MKLRGKLVGKLELYLILLKKLYFTRERKKKVSTLLPEEREEITWKLRVQPGSKRMEQVRARIELTSYRIKQSTRRRGMRVRS